MREEDVDPELRRLVEMMYRGFVINGLDIAEESTRGRFKVIQDRISHLATEFQRNRTGKLCPSFLD